VGKADLRRDPRLQKQLKERMEHESQTLQMLNTHEEIQNKIKPELQQMVDVQKIQHADDKLGFYMGWVQRNAQDIASAMFPKDWLHIVWSLQTQLGYDISRMFRLQISPQKLRDFEQEARNMFGGNKAVDFTSLAEYAGFLSRTLDQGERSKAAPDAQQNFDVVS